MAVLLVLGTAYAIVRIELDGPALGSKIASLLNKRMRGRIEIESIEWPASALKTAVTGGWVPVQIRGVKVWDDCALADSNADPEELRTRNPDQDCTPDDKPDPSSKSARKPRKLLLRTDLVTAELDAHAAMFGNHDLVVRHLVLHGGEALIEQTTEPYPLHAYNRTIVSIVTAFYPRMKAGFRAGIYADSTPPIFDLRDIHLEHVNLTVHVSPSSNKDGTVRFGLAARIEDVDVDGDTTPQNDDYLYMDGSDPLVQKFYFRLGVHGKRGHLRVLDEGPPEAFRILGEGGLADTWAKGRTAKYEIDVSSVDLDRLAQLPVNWAHYDKKAGYDYIANSLEIDGKVHTLPCKTDTGGEPDPKNGADLHITGGLKDYWDRPYDGAWAFHLDATNLGPTVRTCIKSTVGGDKLGGTIELSGPFIALPKVKLDLHDLDLDIPLSKHEEPIQLTMAEVHGEIDLVNDEGSIEKTKARERGGKDPGEVLLSANFGLKPYKAKATVDILKPLDVGRFLPVAVVPAAGRYLTGKLSVDGDIEDGFSLYDFSLSLGHTPSPHDRTMSLYALPAEKGQLFATDYFDHIKLQHIHFEGGKSYASVTGTVDYVDDDWAYKLKILGTYPDLGEWLKRFGLPDIVQSAGGAEVEIVGRGKHPTITVNAPLKGVPCLGDVNASATTKDNITTLRISSGGLGGTLTGNGVISTAGNVPLIEQFHLAGTKLEAGKICGVNGLVSGTIDTAELDLHGTIDKNRSPVDWAALAKVYATSHHLTVKGDALSDVSLCVNQPDATNAKQCRHAPNLATPGGLADCANARDHGGACAVAMASRDAGGTLDATIANVPAARGKNGATTAAHLGGNLMLDAVPMTILDRFLGPGTVGGMFSAGLELGGEVTAQRLAPQASGWVQVVRSWVGTAFVGDSTLQITPVNLLGGGKGVRIQGTALADSLAFRAEIGTEAPYTVDVWISGRRVEVDQFADLGKKLGVNEPVQAWASGTVTLHTELAPKPGKDPSWAWVEVSELSAILNHTSRDGRHVPLVFELAPRDLSSLALSLYVTPAGVTLACRDPKAPGGRTACPAQLATPAGVVQIQGGMTAAGMELTADGDLALDKLGPLLENQLDSIAGTLHLEATVQGSLAKPTYDAKLTAVTPARLRPIGSDTDLRLAKDSRLALANGTLKFEQVKLTVEDQRADQQGAMTVRGDITLDGLKPTGWNVQVDGDIAGKLLQVLAPTAIAQASGLAHIDGSVTLVGSGPLPAVSGSIRFGAVANSPRTASLSLVLRGVRREIALTDGVLDLVTNDTGGQRTYDLEIKENRALRATIDGEGRLERVYGSASFRGGQPDLAEIHLDADNVPYRSADGTLQLTLAANNVELDYGNSLWTARGSIAIVGGSYKRNFDLAEAIKPVPPTVAPAKPIWDEYPSIGNAQIDLALDVRRFAVENNIATIELTGTGIAITGSPRDARLQGSIAVQRGEFKIPLTRAKFTSTHGTIDFSSNDRATNPALNIASEAPDYQDLSGQQHRISLEITGTLELPLWNLHTNSGLDKSQTLALLFLGRSPEQLRRSLGDQSIGVVNQTAGDQSTNPSGTFGDQLVKDLAGDWVSSLLGDSVLKSKWVPVDILRFELGFGTFGVHAEKKLLESVKIVGEGEITTRGNTLKGDIEWRTPLHVIKNDRLSVQGGVLDKSYSDPADQALNISDLNGKLVYRLFIP